MVERCPHEHAAANCVERNLLRGERRVLELIAAGRPLCEVLGTLCLVIEESVGDARCSVLLLDRQGQHLHHAAAPRLPRAYCDAIDGVQIGPSVGSCGTAAHRRGEVVVERIATDPLWRDFNDLALSHGLAACASVPIMTGQGGRIFGTFAIYHSTPGPFPEAELQLLRLMTDVAAIAVVHDERLQGLERMQRGVSLGVLAGGIAHDFNNLLMVLADNVDLAALTLGPDSPAAPHLHVVESIVRRATDLTRMLLAYAGDVRFVLTDVDLNALIAELVRIAAFSVPEHIIIGLELDPTLPALRADFAQTQQLVLNLVTNAIEAIGAEPGSVLVRTRVERLAAPAVAARFAGQALEPGDYAVLEVCDTGCGMTRNTMAHMFEPFFSTKATGHGLGLSMLLGIVKGHRGGVELDSKPGRGTVLRLFLPLPSRVEAANDTANRGARLTVGVTVLLVEDDASVRTVTGRMLQHLGYAVLEATDGQDAIDVLASHAGEVALVIMDVKMPRMDARTALPIINQRWPTLRVLLSSGYASEQNVEDWGGHCVVGFLPKPYRVSALSDALRHAMAAASPV